jgi:hypothetical protein
MAEMHGLALRMLGVVPLEADWPSLLALHLSQRTTGWDLGREALHVIDLHWLKQWQGLRCAVQLRRPLASSAPS